MNKFKVGDLVEIVSSDTDLYQHLVGIQGEVVGLPMRRILRCDMRGIDVLSEDAYEIRVPHSSRHVYAIEQRLRLIPPKKDFSNVTTWDTVPGFQQITGGVRA